MQGGHTVSAPQAQVHAVWPRTVGPHRQGRWVIRADPFVSRRCPAGHVAGPGTRWVRWPRSSYSAMVTIRWQGMPSSMWGQDGTGVVVSGWTGPWVGQHQVPGRIGSEPHVYGVPTRLT